MHANPERPIASQDSPHRCPFHGITRRTFTIYCEGYEPRTYCLACALDLLESLGLREVDRVL